MWGRSGDNKDRCDADLANVKLLLMMIVMIMMITLTFVHLVMLLLMLQPSEGWLMISDWLSTGRSTYQLVMVGLRMMLMI